MNEFQGVAKTTPPSHYKIISIILAILLVIPILTGQVGFILRNQINHQTVKTMARDVFAELDFSKILPSDLIGTQESFILQDVIYSTIDEYYIQSFGVEQENIGELLEQEEFNNSFEDIIDGGVEYITSGEDSQIVSTDKLMGLIENNQDEIERITGYRLVDTDYEDIKKVLTDAGLDGLTWGTAIDSAGDGALKGLFFMYYGSLAIVNIVSVVVIIVMVIIIYLLNRHRASNVLAYFGVPCIVAGVSVMTSSLFIKGIFTVIIKMFDLNSSGGLYNTLTDMGNVVMYTGLTVTCIGAAAVVARIVVVSTGKR